MDSNVSVPSQDTNLYHIRLFISGNEATSEQAKQNITKLCDSFSHDNFRLEIIDIEKKTESALEYNVIVIPMLIVEGAHKSVTIVGSLRDQEKLLHALRIVNC